MASLFSPDSKFTSFMSRVGDLMLLNFFFLLTSLPLVTIGASVTALYTVCFRFGTEREQGTTASYFRAFRDNFRQATVIWLILLVLGAATAFNTAAFFLMPTAMRWAFLLFAALFLLVLLMAALAFPLQSQFENRVYLTLKNALALSLGYLPRALAVVILNVLPFVVLLCDVITFLQAGPIWLLLYFSAAAYANSMLLRKVFAPFRASEEDPS